MQPWIQYQGYCYRGYWKDKTRVTEVVGWKVQSPSRAPCWTGTDYLIFSGSSEAGEAAGFFLFSVLRNGWASSYEIGSFFRALRSDLCVCLHLVCSPAHCILIPRCYVFSGTWRLKKLKTYCKSLLISLYCSVIGMANHFATICMIFR